MYVLLIQIVSVVLVVLAGGSGTSHVAGLVVAGDRVPDVGVQGAFFRFPRALRPDKLTLVVATVHRGSKYSDLCISGLDFITKIDTFD